MPPRKRTAAADADEPAPKRSLRSATRAINEALPQPIPTVPAKPVSKSRRGAKAEQTKTDPEPSKTKAKAKKPSKPDAKKTETPISSIPTHNPDCPQHDGEWYWLMKAEPETRLENGIDVRFSIDDLRARTEPEGWDGIRNYAARNHMRNMNAGDKAFFYHSNCKEPGIVGIMEIVKEFSQDVTALQPGTPYYDASATADKPKWDLVHVEFRKKFAVKIGLKELKELGEKGGPLEGMQMLKQSRLSVSRVQAGEWEALCEVADRKAEEAGLEHET